MQCEVAVTTPGKNDDWGVYYERGRKPKESNQRMKLRGARTGFLMVLTFYINSTRGRGGYEKRRRRPWGFF